MYKEIIDILTEIKRRISDDSDVAWTRYNHVDDLRKYIDDCISRLQRGDRGVLDDINIDFGPTSIYQELSIQNGWTDDYMRLANQFDKSYKQFK